jgi:hypothetical protein
MVTRAWIPGKRVTKSRTLEADPGTDKRFISSHYKKGDMDMNDFMDWKPRARWVLSQRRGYSPLQYCFEDLPDGVFLEVLEHTANLLREKHKDHYPVFLENVQFAYDATVKRQADEKARIAPGDPAALIRFPGKGT